MSSPPSPFRPLRRLLRTLAVPPLLLIAGIWLLVEEYLWNHLEPWVRRFSRLRPVARLEASIAGLPPWAALTVFAAPDVVLFLPKLLALWATAHGAVVSGTTAFVLLKVVGAALGARIFILTRPVLMQLAWFSWLHGWFLRASAFLHGWLEAQPLWRGSRRRLVALRAWLAGWRGGMRPWALRQFLALRTLLARRRQRAQH